jgi:hypothetical protein
MAFSERIITLWNLWLSNAGSATGPARAQLRAEPTVSYEAPKPQARRGTRIPCDIPATLVSSCPTQSFCEPCEIILVNPQGCAARFPRPLEIGTEVLLQGLQNGLHLTAKVVNCIEIKNHENFWLLGLALDEPGNVWGIQSPPDDWDTLALT